MAMEFGDALASLRDGKKLARKGWNGVGQYLALEQPTPDNRLSRPYIIIVAVDGSTVPWVASQTDILANDWFVVD